MKKASCQTHWLIDLGLMVGFLLAFYLDLTGVSLHQWLGVILAVLALVHLLLHWDWFANVVCRFFGKTSGRSRVYLLLDVLIMLGTVMIIETGLVISTWFNLDLYDYATWLDIHIYSSVATLGLTVVKLGLHWRWIVLTTKKIFGRQIPVRVPQGLTPAAVPVRVEQKQVGRRQFLVLMGAVGAASALAATNVLVKSVSAQSGTLLEETTDSSAASAQATTTPASVAETQPPSTEAATATPAPTATSVPQVVYSTPVQRCTVRCPRGCSYPGHCRRYTDSNGNNRCDLGECL